MPEDLYKLFPDLKLPMIMGGSNPGGVGHTWVKEAFVDLLEPYELRQMDKENGGMLRQYIPALLEDNPSMAEDDPTYEDRLLGLGGALAKAMRYGDWNVVEGAYFDVFDINKHVIRPFEIPSHWARFRAFDWGSARPFSVGWYAVSSGDRGLPRGAPARGS